MLQFATRPWITVGVAAVGAGLISAAPVTVPLPGVQTADIQLTATDIVIDFIRHAESTDNAAHIIGTMPPGAHLTELGQSQAQGLIDRLGDNDYDGLFASWLVRTQETAAPLADHLGMDVEHLAGLNEINAGIFEGINQGSVSALAYLFAPMMWAWGLYGIPQFGATDFNGMAFQASVAEAVDRIYEVSTEEGAVGHSAAFSHGATMMFWTMMNVDNPTPWLWITNPLRNVNEVVIEGNPTDGWTLISWAGIEQDLTPSLMTQLFASTRDLIVAPQMAMFNIQQGLVDSLVSQDPSDWLNAAQAGFNDVLQTTMNYPTEVLGALTSYFNGDIELGWDEWSQGLQIMGGLLSNLAMGVWNSWIPTAEASAAVADATPDLGELLGLFAA